MQTRFSWLKNLTIAAVIITAASPAAQAADDRMVVTLPPTARDGFLSEMRAHLGTLNEITEALAGNRFAEAADLADLRLDFGHSLWEALIADGMSVTDVRAIKQRLADKGLSPGLGNNDPAAFHDRMAAEMPDVMEIFRKAGAKPGMGPGRYLPPDFRLMGGSFHEAGTAFASAARAAGNPPTAADYAAVMSALNQVVATCWGCHETWRVAP